MQLKFIMHCLALIVVFCKVVFVVTKAFDYVDEYYAKFVTNVCENNRTINEDMNNCFEKHSQTVLDVVRDCINRAEPSSRGSVVNFFEMACKDKYAYIKYYSCMSAYESNPELKKQMRWTPEIIACFKAVVKKYA